jgi:hypothetical protein
VLIPILGIETGLLYVGARAAIAAAITLVGVAAGAVLLSRGAGTEPAAADDPDRPESAPDGGTAAAGESDDPDSPAAVLRTAAGKTWPKLKRIVPRLAVVYVLVTLVVETQDLRSVTGIAEPLTALLGLPGASLPVIAVFAFDTTAGAATIAPLIGDPFTPRTAVATMLLGGIVSFAVSTFKRSIPFQYGIWGPRFGSKVIAVNTALKIVFIAIALVILLAPA